MQILLVVRPGKLLSTSWFYSSKEEHCPVEAKVTVSGSVRIAAIWCKLSNTTKSSCRGTSSGSLGIHSRAELVLPWRREYPAHPLERRKVARESLVATISILSRHRPAPMIGTTLDCLIRKIDCFSYRWAEVAPHEISNEAERIT